MFQVDPNTLYAIEKLERSIEGIVGIDTFLKNLGLKANRMFRGAVWGWEILDGSYRGVDFDIEFGYIRRIERLSSRRATVTLKDGRAYELSGSNDVDRNNKGIFVQLEDGSTVAIDWASFRGVEFR